ncbi:centrosomal protein [Clonorchis sinensis]|uniref:Centrosomal protein n=1 Tax=Clonorchis sinensis TaxID=79923 RepID=G7Y7C3_CLOSI|nr:centrosomal protein [Clonorchis sinensis]
MYSAQCLEKVRNLEVDAKRMTEHILLLQEKDAKAVICTPAGNKKLPFRQQRMEIDSLIPQPERCKTDPNYCCSIARYWDRMHLSYEPETLDLLDLASKRCEDLEKHLVRLEKELELSENNVENLRHQIELRDSELERLRSLSEVGCPVKSPSKDATVLPTDRSLQQLQIQVASLQSRNEQLEARLVNHTHISSIPSPLLSGDRIQSNVAVGTQTSTDCFKVQTNSSCQTVSMSCTCTPCLKESFKGIEDLLNKIQSGRSYLLQRLDRLEIRERDLIKELSSRVMDPRFGRPDDQHRTNMVTLNRALEKRLKGLEDDCRRWRSDSQAAMDAFRQLLESALSGQLYQTRLPPVPEPKSTTMQPGCKPRTVPRRTFRGRRALTPPCVSCNSVKPRRCFSADFPDRRGYANEVNLLRLKHMVHENWRCEPNELMQLRQERDNLRSLLDTFERQLSDIQSNIRVLTQERNNLCEQLQQTKCELSQTRDQLLRLEALNDCRRSSTQPTTSSFGEPRSSNITRSIVRHLENDRDQLAEVLRQMTTERDSLQDRLHDITTQNLNEKAKWLQRVEDTEQELDRLRQTRESDAHSLADMSCRINLLETERRELLDRLDELANTRSKDDRLAAAERNLCTVQTRLDQVQQECEKWREEGVKLRHILRQLDQEKDAIQATLDMRTEQCETLERELARLKRQANEHHKSSQTSELRVLRLTESVAERDAECRQLGERTALLELELNQTKEARDGVAQELKQTKCDLDAMISEVRNLTMKLHCGAEKEVELQKRLDTSALELCKLKETCSCVEQERICILNQYRDLTVELDGKAAMIARLENRLQDAQHVCSVREHELSSLRHQNEATRKDVVDYQKATRALESQCSLLTRNASESEDRVKRLQLENEEVHRELTEVRALCDRLERQAHTVQNQLTTGNLETDQLRAHLAETEREISNLRKQLNHEKEAVRNLESALSTSRDNELKARKDIQNCCAELQFTRERLENRNSRLIEADRVIDNLRNQLSLLQPPSIDDTHNRKFTESPQNGLTELNRSRTNSTRAPERTKSLNSEHLQPVVDTGMSNAAAPLQQVSPADSVLTESNLTGVDLVKPRVVHALRSANTFDHCSLVNKHDNVSTKDWLCSPAHSFDCVLQTTPTPCVRCVHGCLHSGQCVLIDETEQRLLPSAQSLGSKNLCRHLCFHSSTCGFPLAQDRKSSGRHTAMSGSSTPLHSRENISLLGSDQLSETLGINCASKQLGIDYLISSSAKTQSDDDLSSPCRCSVKTEDSPGGSSPQPSQVEMNVFRNPDTH